MRPRVLVVAPLRVARTVWPREAEQWKGSEWDRLRTLEIRLLHGPRKEFEAAQDADIYVINKDGLKWLLEDGGYQRFLDMRLDTLVWDESTALKNTRTKRFKLMKKIFPTFKRRWILTGSPNPKSYLDLFGQMYCVDLGRSLGPYITHYRMNFFNPLDRFGWTWVLKPGADAAIQKAISPYAFRLEATDLPELVENIIRVDLPDGARKIYDEMEAEFIAEAFDRRGEPRTIVAVNKSASYMKCSQIANGGVYQERVPGETKRRWIDLHTAKIEAVQELVEELNGTAPLVVYEYDHDLARLRAAFPEWPWIGGGVSAGESERLLDDWNADKLPGLFCQPATVSHGVNMQYGNSQHIIFHSLIYDYEVYDQLVRRLRRQGSKHRAIFVHFIVARDTVDEAKLATLRRKEKSMRAFLEAMKGYMRERGR